MKRLLTLAALTGALLAFGGLAGVASAEELADYLDRASEAEYSGRQIVVTYWDDETYAGLYEVDQAGGMIMVGDTVSRSMVGNGKIGSVDPNGRSSRELEAWADWRLADRYAMQPPATGRRLGRPVTVITVLEDGRPRMRVAFDAGTGAPLLTEVFDGNGELYRIAAMVEFDPVAPVMPVSEMEESKYSVVAPAIGSTLLPEEAGGYWRADTYGGPDATVHAFFTDGLFTFSVFEFAGRAHEGGFEDAAKLEVGDLTYKRLSDPGSVLVFWRTADATYLLVGELPPDHLRRVLGDLPDPGDKGLLGRIWRGVFG